MEDSIERLRKHGTIECKKHGKSRVHVSKDKRMKNGYRVRCAPCQVEAVINARRRRREQLVNEAGGKCIICGYSKYVGALDFHHIDPSKKSFGLSSRGFCRSIKAMREEAAKCVLVCKNCHAEIEAGGVTLASGAMAAQHPVKVMVVGSNPTSPA